MNENTAEPRLDPLLHQRPPRDPLGIQDVLDRMAQGVTAGDGQMVARLWAVPAYIIGDDTERVVNSIDEAAQFFGGAKDRYHQMGVTQTRADVQRLEEIGAHLVRVKVRWPWLDADGREVGGETSTYILRRDDQGEWKIRVAVMHGAEAH